MQVELIIKREVNDHDGYCSGNDNEYTCETVNIKVKLPKQYESLELGSVIVDHDWTKELNIVVPKVNKDDGSYYCENNAEGHGLGVHDYRLTVLSATVVV